MRECHSCAYCVLTSSWIPTVCWSLPEYLLWMYTVIPQYSHQTGKAHVRETLMTSSRPFPASDNGSLKSHTCWCCACGEVPHIIYCLSQPSHPERKQYGVHIWCRWDQKTRSSGKRSGILLWKGPAQYASQECKGRCWESSGTEGASRYKVISSA